VKSAGGRDELFAWLKCS